MPFASRIEFLSAVLVVDNFVCDIFDVCAFPYSSGSISDRSW